ncbi:MAG: hypothetical protein Q4D16_20975 [Eubacteriales bacterium]|nr:hypothetical protein [Eubacteriales bacterium]
MRSFRKILLRLILIAAFLKVFDMGIRFAYQAPGTTAIYAINDLKESKGQVETLILGTSLVHWGIKGLQLGDALESTTYNLATAAQPLNGSYYLLKDQVKHNDIKRLFLGVHVSSMTRDYNSNIKLREGIYDRMLSPLSKIEYLYQTADYNEYLQYLFFSARLDNLTDWDQVKNNVEYKLSNDFKENRSPAKRKYVYQGMGDENTKAVYKGTFAKKRLPRRSCWDRSLIIDKNVEYLQKIADFCEEEGIELNLVIMPMVQEITRLMGDMNDMHVFYQEFCDKNNARLFDFYQYENIYEILPNDCYQDEKHLNSKGAEKFTELFANWYQEG